MKKNTLGGALLLIGAAMIWGVAFAAQSAGMRYIGPFSFTAVRSVLAALFLLPCSFLFDRSGTAPGDRASTRQEIVVGLILGLILFAATNLQQIGLQYTSASKSGFITSLYIVMVPVFGLLLKKRVPPILWLCVGTALTGFYVLSVNNQFSIGLGDLLTLACAACFSLHILCIDRFAARMNVVRLSCIQFSVISLLSAPLMFLFEKPLMGDILSAWLPLIYAGVFSGGLAYTMQMFGQRRMEPAAASLLCSSEATFAALAGWIILHERLSGRELTGCALVLTAVVCSQLPFRGLHKRKSMI